MPRLNYEVRPSRDQARRIRSLRRAAQACGCRARRPYPAPGRSKGTKLIVITGPKLKLRDFSASEHDFWTEELVNEYLFEDDPPSN
jgi:hypothetical protein